MTAPLTRSLRARQCAARNDRMAAAATAKAARYPEDSAVHAEWRALAADHRETADRWRAIADSCSCGGPHTEEQHDGEALLDDAADMYADHS
jgi:hypothetical protein